MFQQVLNPAGNLWLDVLISPGTVDCVAVHVGRAAHDGVAGHHYRRGATIAIGVLVWQAPFGGTMKSYLYGGLPDSGRSTGSRSGA